MTKYKSELSENIVIGALINDINLILDMKDLKTNHFMIKVNKMLFVTIKRLFKAGSENIDISDIYALVETNPKHLKILEDAGGTDLLENLIIMGEGKSAEDIKPHIENIRQAAFKNELDDTLTALQENVALSGNKPISAIYREVENEMLSVKSKYATSDGLKLIGEDLEGLLEKIDIESKREFSGFPTSIPMLNNFCTYERGELVVVAAKMKTGKSLFVTHEVAYLCIKNKVPCLILDSEMSTKSFLIRLIACLTEYQVKYIKTGQYKENEVAIRKVNQAIQDIKEAKLIHKYIVGMSEQELTNEIKRVKIQHNIQVVFYDYIKASVTSDENQQERLQLGHITNWLKNDIAGDMNLSVIALAQTNPYAKNDGVYKTFGSSQISMYASSVIYMIKKSDEEIEGEMGREVGGNYRLYVSENRNGQQWEDPSWGINLCFDTGRVQITQAQYQPQQLLDLVKEQQEENKDNAQ